MFTGLIREIGTLRRLSGGGQLSTLVIHAPETACRVGDGDSLAVNGICLTVTDAPLRFKGLLPRLAQPFFRI